MYTIRRKGTFDAYLVPGTAHCGVGDGQVKTFTYEAWICMGDEGLNYKGFVVDNAIFKKFFDGEPGKVTHLSMSCEELAHRSAKHFFKAAAQGGRKEYIHEVCVQIWGLPGEAYAEFKWTKAGSLATIMK